MPSLDERRAEALRAIHAALVVVDEMSDELLKLAIEQGVRVNFAPRDLGLLGRSIPLKVNRLQLLASRRGLCDLIDFNHRLSEE